RAPERLRIDTSGAWASSSPGRRIKNTPLSTDRGAASRRGARAARATRPLAERGSTSREKFSEDGAGAIPRRGEVVPIASVDREQGARAPRAGIDPHQSWCTALSAPGAQFAGLVAIITWPPS